MGKRVRKRISVLSIIIQVLLLSILSSGCNINSSGNLADTNPSKKFSLEKHSGYTILTISDPWQGAKNIKMEYFLVKRDSVIPRNIDSSKVIFVPVKNIICMSTTHLGMIEALGEVKTVSGFSGTDYIYSDSIKSLVKAGKIRDVGYEANLNKELILSIKPDLIMMYGIGNESAGYINKLRELGLKFIFNADYLETDPISKAEWIKVFGALYCKESLADSIFTNEKRQYEDLKFRISKSAINKPKVLLGLPFKDTWFISPGNSYISNLIIDAGGDYIWKNTESSVSMPYGIESVYSKAIHADYWLNTGSALSSKEIMSIDKRLSKLKVFINGELYNNIKRMNEAGANDYWESGAVYPHLVLKDIATILHPELFPEKELVFYSKLDSMIN